VYARYDASASTGVMGAVCLGTGGVGGEDGGGGDGDGDDGDDA
jgi:hypothetical protein